mgnify:FL=1
MSNLYKSSSKCYLIDHHSPQPPIIPLNHLDINEYEAFIDTANVDSMMVYCKDHWGVTYYPSKVPGAQMHQGITNDWIKSVSTLLKKKKIEFIAYYCIEYDEGAARNHPEWRARKADGSPLIREDTYARWSLCCYQTSYREYCLAQLKEIVTNYAPDALFLDIFGASLCYCGSCRKKFQDLYGYPLPETSEDIHLHISDIIKFLDDNAYDFFHQIKTELKAIDPSLAITVNFSCHYPQKFRELLDYQFSEPLLSDNWYSSAYARDTAEGQFPILSPGEASQVYNYAPQNQYIYNLSSIAAQNCRVGMYSGSQHRDGTLDFEEAKRLGVAYHILDEMSPWLTGRAAYGNVGIIQSDASKAIHLPQLVPDAILRMKRHCPHTNAVLGAMKLCENAKIPWRVLPEAVLTPDLLKQYDLLLLPEVYVVSPQLLKLLQDYAASGGKIISSMESGLWNPDGTRRDESVLSELLGVSFKELHHEYSQNTWAAYLTPKNGFSFQGLLSCTTTPVSSVFSEVQCIRAHEIAEFILPSVACDFQHWVNWWSPPPGDPSGYPAITLNKYGKGHVLYTAFDYFTMAAEETYEDTDLLFQDFFNALDFVPRIQNKTPYSHVIRTAFSRQRDHYLAHQISSIPHLCKGEAPPISGGELVIQGKISSAFLVYPRKENLSFRYDGKVSVISLPDFSMQQIISFKMFE